MSRQLLVHGVIAALALFFSPITTAALVAGQRHGNDLVANVGVALVATSAQASVLPHLPGRARVGYLLPFALLSWPAHCDTLSVLFSLVVLPNLPFTCLAQVLLLADFTSALALLGSYSSPTTCLVLLGTRIMLLFFPPSMRIVSQLVTAAVAVAFTLAQVRLIQMPPGSPFAPVLGYFSVFAIGSVYLVLVGLDQYAAFFIFPYAFFGSFVQCSVLTGMYAVAGEPNQQPQQQPRVTP